MLGKRGCEFFAAVSMILICSTCDVIKTLASHIEKLSHVLNISDDKVTRLGTFLQVGLEDFVD